jgi:hypothetical protein
VAEREKEMSATYREIGAEREKEMSATYRERERRREIKKESREKRERDDRGRNIARDT